MYTTVNSMHPLLLTLIHFKWIYMLKSIAFWVGILILWDGWVGVRISTDSLPDCQLHSLSTDSSFRRKRSVWSSPATHNWRPVASAWWTHGHFLSLKDNVKPSTAGQFVLL